MRNDDGMVTIETAIASSALIVFATLIFAGLTVVANYLSAIDIAGAAARAHVIGVDYVPPKGRVHINNDGERATATATIPTFFIDVEAQAVFAIESVHDN
ncbi:putative secreted protein [Corynebacterium kutscheri]|uniref:Secreted protein n=1 Tax=Corynebacterium kutscheri TaxID=35755 RepID=A0A0F6QY91_9CORY|nr:hypothetical protein [Corynebacterium kutscheri]AKE40427.1 hypothetical protein UL82_00970 [Corynebacterium kutscheri]VEH05225.1 putative secreted protein [Corynebacterium kutscheri]VEH10822.1 putative secreted protein [Corynebacterium kutscheri]VEH80699.1 putative secreted protein [Corynebacterium kutscheri]